ncbi:MAG TPA: hypothetical protein VKW06_12025 [Candidatus Angelobacter sp.]|nr:hypothetical protein [Candidatus Angelobacter sp.]
MKLSLSSRVLILAAGIALTTPAFAGGAGHQGYVTFGDSVQINGKQVPAGEYKVTWDGDGPGVNLHILRGSKEVATAPATVTPLNTKASEDAAETHSTGNGRELTALRFHGKSYQLDVGSTAGQAAAKGGDSVK